MAGGDRHPQLEVDLDFIGLVPSGKGPRYTSYPTADRFVEAFDANAYRIWASKRNIGGISRPLSIYVHVPFCNTVCFYCACNKIVTKEPPRRPSTYWSTCSRDCAAGRRCSIDRAGAVDATALGWWHTDLLSRGRAAPLMQRYPGAVSDLLDA